MNAIREEEFKIKGLHHTSFTVSDMAKSLPFYRDVLGFEVRTVVGLSNLTAGSKGHPKGLLLEQAYLSMLAAAGLDMVLLNIHHSKAVAAAKASDALIGGKPFAWDGF